MNHAEIQAILQNIGTRVPPNSQLTLVGGSALALLGSPRLTIDIDFLGDDLHPSPLHQTILQIARELKIYVEPVPLDRFVPLPKGNEERTIHIGRFGNLEIYVADPYSIALSKLDRGADTDLDDIVFLVHNNLVRMDEFEQIIKDALPQAKKFEFNPELLEHLRELNKRLKR